MKGRVIVLDQIAGRGAAALVVDGVLQDLAVDPVGDAPLPGAIFRGIVDRPMKGQGGVFVKLPDGQSGFLRQVSGLAPGQAVLVQLTGAAEPGKALPRERLWQVRAKRVIIASGAIERHMVFANNDRPGIMLAGALSIESLPIAQYPSIAPPTIAIIATYPGASAKTLEDTVT